VPSRLLCPPVESRPLPQLRHRFTIPPSAIPSWPWQETMLTAFNSYMLWCFTWLHFVITLSSFSSRGSNLWFYTEVIDPFGLNIPETFLVISILLSVFAVSAVIGSTWKSPRLWKRVFCVCLFAGFAISFSIINLHLRHYCYLRALELRSKAHNEYIYSPRINYGDNVHYEEHFLKWQRSIIEEYDAQIRRYGIKYDIQ